MLRRIKYTIGLGLSLGLLSGCAGLNELSNGELLGQPQSAGMNGYSPAVARVNDSGGTRLDQGMGQNAAQSNPPAGQMPEQQQVVAQNDPIDAPPPPMGEQSSSAVSLSRQDSASGPLMLVPPPGAEQAEFNPGQGQMTSMQSSIPMAARNNDEMQMRDQGEIVPVMSEPAAPIEEQPLIVSSTANTSQMRGREFVPASLSVTGPVSDAVRPGEIPLTREQVNVITRFAVLNDLRDMGLLTQDEYMQRRSKNIGAILPYTHEPPAAGLDRQVPNREAIASRLMALKRSLEMRAITARQHALERSVILDGLLPRTPARLANPEPPPTDVIDAAATLGHLERLRFEGVISNDEFDQEKNAIDRFLQTGILVGDSVMANEANDNTATDDEVQRESVDAGLGVHLASYRSEQAARTGWSNLEKKFSSQLSGLSPVIRRVDLGASKGTYYRLFGGPVGDSGRANTICQQLKRSDQYCDPLRYDG